MAFDWCDLGKVWVFYIYFLFEFLIVKYWYWYWNETLTLTKLGLALLYRLIWANKICKCSIATIETFEASKEYLSVRISNLEFFFFFLYFCDESWFLVPVFLQRFMYLLNCHLSIISCVIDYYRSCYNCEVIMTSKSKWVTFGFEIYDVS